MSGKDWEPNSDVFTRGRVLEYTPEQLIAQFKPNGSLDLSAVTNIPTLFASESRYDDSQNLARVGRITRVRETRTEYQLDYVFDPLIPPITNSTLQTLARTLRIDDFEFSRTHWAIKEADLFEVLLKAGLSKRAEPKVFNIESDVVDESLVAVMMPFDARFNPVYAALQAAVSSAGMVCQRADDIWVHDHIIQDVVSLISKASVVICDLTGRNANVFYEMGIAHTLGKDVIMITQSASDVPFDVAHIRHIRYLQNGEGMNTLSQEVTRRLSSLQARR